MDLTTFLLERIAEDEAAARAFGSITTLDWEFSDDAEPSVGCIGMTIAHIDQPLLGAHIARHDPARVLAQCAALRAVVEQAARASGFWDFWDGEQGQAGLESDPGQLILRALASIWAGADGWQETWAL